MESRRGGGVKVGFLLGLPVAFGGGLYLAGDALAGSGLTPVGPGIINHPIGMKPSARVRIPADWPLGRDGQMTCWTCHTSIPNPDSPEDFGLRGTPDQPAPVAFCASCHRDPISGDERPHWRALDRAHIGTEVDQGQATGTLDTVSRRCASCHDGVSAFDSGNHAASQIQGGFQGDPRRDHPVGVQYESTGSTGTTGLRPQGALPDSVILPGGRVTCISCHNLYAGDSALLSVPIEGSELCFACHAMD